MDTSLTGLPVDLQTTVQQELQRGERVRWMGQPVPGSASSAGSWGIFLFAIPWTAFSLFWMVGASGLLFGAHSGPPVAFRILFPLFGLPFVGMGIWMLSAPWRTKKKLARMMAQTAYVITDRRAIIVDNGFASLGNAAGIMAMAPKFFGRTEDEIRIQSFAPAQLQNIVRIQRANGLGDLLFSESTMPVYDHRHHHEHMVSQSIGFKGIAQVQEVERMLRDLAGQSAEESAEAPPIKPV